MDKKYEILLDDRIEYDGRILYQIKSLIKFYDIDGNTIDVGELGGYIENESNLNQYDNSWIDEDSTVYGDSTIENSLIKDNSTIDNSRIKNSIVKENSTVIDSTVKDYSTVKRNSNIRDSLIREYAYIEKSNIDNSMVELSTIDNSTLTKANIRNNVTIKDRTVTGKITMPFKDMVQHQCRHRILTAILTEDDKILYTIGCQENITKEQFIDRIHNKDGGLEENSHREEYLKLIPTVEAYFRKK